MTDTDAIMDLLTPLAVAGITRMRTRQDILQDLHQFTVVQRENKVGRQCLSSQDLTCTAYAQPLCLLHVARHRPWMPALCM